MIYPAHLDSKIPSYTKGKKNYVRKRYKKSCTNTSMTKILLKILMIIFVKDLELQKILFLFFKGRILETTGNG